MAVKYLLGAAAAALVAVGVTGAAQAADVMPVVVPTVTPVVVVPTGPKIEIESWNAIEIGVFPGDPIDIETHNDFSLKVTTQSGVGFQLLGEVHVELPGFFVYGETTGRVFLSRGDFEVGLYSVVFFNSMGFDGVTVGGDVVLENDRLELMTYLEADFFGGFEDIEAGGEVVVHLGDMLDLYAGIDTDLFPAFDLDDLWAGVQAHFGPLSPYVGAFLTFPGVGFEVGTEFEHRFGTSPLSLVGYAEAEFDGGGPEFYLGLGIKFSRGADE